MLIRIFNIIFKYLRNQREINDDEMPRIYETLFYEKIFVIFCANVFLTNKYLMTVYYYLVYGLNHTHPYEAVRLTTDVGSSTTAVVQASLVH